MKLRRKMLGVLLAGTMVMGMGATAMAQEPQPQEGTEANPAKASVTKELQFAEGVETPDVDFTFDFTADTFEESTALPTGTPNLDTTISYDGTEPGSTSDGLTTVVKETGNIFAGKTFPAAGVYEYSVVETATGVEGMDDSQAEYTMKVYVKNGVDGTYVYSVTVNQDKNDEGETGTGKVDPEQPETPGIGNGFRFVNVYTEQGGNPDDPDAKALTISKTVAGEYGDHTKDFTFSVTLTRAATASDESYTGYVGDESYTFEPGTAKEVTLKHGESLTFDSLPVGTKYTVVETGTAKYTGSAVVTEGEDVTNVNDAQEGANLTVSDKLVKAGANNSTAVTNTYDDASVTPTGIIINNLPFILLIVAAAAGIALYAVSRRRFNR